MGDFYTELFFLDEATAMAAGHRPCFECRRKDAVKFAKLWAEVRGQTGRAYVAQMDKVLHAERLGERDVVQDVPVGAMFRHAGADYLRCERGSREWSFDGYGPLIKVHWEVEAITPRSIREVLAAGYKPQVHESARE